MDWNTIRIVGFILFVSMSSPIGAQLEAEKLSVAERLEQTSVVSIFTAALKQSGVWPVVQNSKSLTLFVPADFALEHENSAFLLQTVLMAPDNKGRLINTLSYHMVPGVSHTFGTMGSSQQLTTLSGECLPVTTAGSDLAGSDLKVGPEASVIVRIRGANGVIYVIDHMLWSPFEGTHCQPIMASRFQGANQFGKLISDDQSLSSSLHDFNTQLQGKYEQDEFFSTLDEASGGDFVLVAHALVTY